MLGSSEDVGDVVGRVLCWLKLGGDEEENKSGGIGVVVGSGVEVMGMELGSGVMLNCEGAEGSAMLGVTLGGELVGRGLSDVGLSDVGFGVLDVDGGSSGDVVTGGSLEGVGGSVGMRDGGDEGRSVGTGGEDGRTSGGEVEVGRGISVVGGTGTGGELRGSGGSLAAGVG